MACARFTSISFGGLSGYWGELDAALQHGLGLLGPLLALVLSLAEELRELRVVLALGVLDVGLQPQRVGETLLGEPDDVVVLVLRPGDVAGLGGGRFHVGFLLELG